MSIFLSVGIDFFLFICAYKYTVLGISLKTRDYNNILSIFIVHDKDQNSQRVSERTRIIHI